MDITKMTPEEVYRHFLTLDKEKAKENYYLIETFALKLTQYNDILFQDAFAIANVYFRGWDPHGIVERILKHDMRGALLDQSTHSDFHALYRVMDSVFGKDVMDNGESYEGFRKARSETYEGLFA